MKKQYIQPEMKLIQLNHSTSLLAGSQVVVGMSYEDADNSAALSRRGNFFDDEKFDDEEEEY